MNSRERIIAALNHQAPDRVPLDLGSSLITGIHVSSLHRLKVALGLIQPQEPVKVFDPFQMLGEVDEDLRRALGIDTIPLESPTNFFGYANQGWKPWTFFDGTPLLVPEKFSTTVETGNYIYQYPRGDHSAQPSAHMPVNGFYFDCIVRGDPDSEKNSRIEDQIEEIVLLSDEDLRYYEAEAQRLHTDTDYAIVSGGVPGTNLGDIAFIPGPSLAQPKGIRDIAEWYMALVAQPDYVKQVFEKMTEIGLENLKRFHQAVGDKIQVIIISGTDFGAQDNLFFSPQSYLTLYKPLHCKINQWVHENTSWKTFIHTCGSMYDLLDEIADAGFDIFNPVQISAAKMDPQRLKREFGSRLTFWGGGINTQDTLPFGSVDAVAAEVKHLLEIFQQGGGFVYNTVHNIQASVPVENMIALFDTLNAHR